MRYAEIFEAGVRTAEIDTAAAKAIREVAPDVARDLMVFAEKRGIKVEEEPVDDRWSRYYDRLHDFFKENQQYVIQTINADVGHALTTITRKHVIAKFGNKGFDSRDGYQIWPRDIYVTIEAKEYSQDRKKDTAGGYYSPGHAQMKVFVKADEVFEAVMSLIQEKIFGESFSEVIGDDALIDAVGPTFVHEYAHLEQDLKGKFRKSGDFGYITGKEKGRGRKGRRGGLLRNHTKDEDAYHRYLGSTHEMDSFASGAASEIVNAIRHDNRRHFMKGEEEGYLRRGIEAAREALSWGDRQGGQYEHYRKMAEQMFADYWEGHRPNHLDPMEVRKVWQRFQKLVWQKLGDYLKDKSGKASDYDAKQFDPLWIKWAKAFPRHTVIQHLAGVLAAKIAFEMSREINQGKSLDDMMRDWDIHEVMRKGEKFIALYYFNDEWEESPDTAKTLDIFRRMVRADVAEKLAARQSREPEPQP